MVFVVARKHALRLRAIALILMIIFPALLISLPGSGAAISVIAVLSHLAGVLAARWLFFAEAEHVVGLYYGQR
jgi:DMSO reductase anchor subunit